MLAVLKIVLPISLLAWLAYEVPRGDPEAFHSLWHRPKDWGLLLTGVALMLTAVSLTFVRWHMLVRGINLPFRLVDAFRLGFLGYMLSFVTLGNVGGDLLKAILLAREQQSRRTEAVASVVVDRLVGMFALLLVASTALWTIHLTTPAIAVLARATRLVTLAFALIMGLMLLPDFSRSLWVRRMMRMGRLGLILQRVTAALACYRQRKGLLAVSIGMSLAVHVLMALAIFCGSTGLFDQTPSLGEHLVISPLAAVAGALPIAPAGLGTFEYAMAYLFRYVPAATYGAGQGMIVALCYRLMTLVIAAVGLVYYLWNRRVMREVIQQAESEAVGE